MGLNWPQSQMLFIISHRHWVLWKAWLKDRPLSWFSEGHLSVLTLELVWGSWNKCCWAPESTQRVHLGPPSELSPLCLKHIAGVGGASFCPCLLSSSFLLTPHTPDLFPIDFKIYSLYLISPFYYLFSASASSALCFPPAECSPNTLQVFCEIPPHIPLYQGTLWHLSIFLQHTHSSSQIWYSWQRVITGGKKGMKLGNKSTPNQQLLKGSQQGYSSKEGRNFIHARSHVQSAIASSFLLKGRVKLKIFLIHITANWWKILTLKMWNFNEIFMPKTFSLWFQTCSHALKLQLS